jgi:hypothetical protein
VIESLKAKLGSKGFKLDKFESINRYQDIVIIFSKIRAIKIKLYQNKTHCKYMFTNVMQRIGEEKKAKIRYERESRE